MDKVYSSLTVAVTHDDYDGSYILGVEVNGGFVPFARIQDNRFEKWLVKGATPQQPAAPTVPQPTTVVV